MRPRTRFNTRDRLFLTRQPGISNGVVARLEALGVTSVEALEAVGVDEVCAQLRAAHSWDVWANRRRALQAALDAAMEARASLQYSSRLHS
jgi:hypothetical protein